MSLRNYGIGKRELRQGSGRGNGNDHFDDLIGSTEFYIYQALDKKAKGYEGLKLYLETQGCEVMHSRMRLLSWGLGMKRYGLLTEGKSRYPFKL